MSTAQVVHHTIMLWPHRGHSSKARDDLLRPSCVSWWLPRCFIQQTAFPPEIPGNSEELPKSCLLP